MRGGSRVRREDGTRRGDEKVDGWAAGEALERKMWFDGQGFGREEFWVGVVDSRESGRCDGWMWSGEGMEEAGTRRRI